MYTADQKTVSRVASQDMNSDAFYLHAVEQISNANFKVGLPAAGGGFGILTNKPKLGENASVVTEGEQEVRVGAAVTAGAWAMSAASGWVIPVASTTVYNVLGRFATGAASGMIAVLHMSGVWRGPTA